MLKKKILIVGLLGNLAMLGMPSLSHADVDSSGDAPVDIVNFFPATIAACDAKYSATCSNKADNNSPQDTQVWEDTYENPNKPALFIGSCGMRAIKDVRDALNEVVNGKNDPDSSDAPEVQQALANYMGDCPNSPMPTPHYQVNVTFHPLSFQSASAQPLAYQPFGFQPINNASRPANSQQALAAAHAPETDSTGTKVIDITLSAFFGPQDLNPIHLDPTSSANTVSYDPYTDLVRNGVSNGCPNEELMLKRIKSNANKIRDQIVSYLNNKRANSCAGLGVAASSSGDARENQIDQSEGLLAPPVSGVAH